MYYRLMSARLTYLSLIYLFFLTSCGGGNFAPVVDYGQSSGAGSAGVHTVSRGDTLYSVSNRYLLPMRDIAILNNMKPPFKLYEGQRLRLPPPREYKVQSGDTLYGVSRMFNVNSFEVANMNNIRSPYILRRGQILRLPSVIGELKDENSSIVKPNKSKLLSVPKVNKAEVLASSSIRPKSKPAIIKDGVLVPKSKPWQSNKVAKRDKAIRVSKVYTKTPKRSSAKFLRPVRGKIISGFGPKKSGLHNDGINIAAKHGTSVKAAENGVVVYAGNALKGSGNLILIRHENQWMTAYAHLDKITVRKGQVVSRGSVIGKVGSTGSVSKPQLHFEVRRGTSALNPTKYMER